jgi:hypothetical protein
MTSALPKNNKHYCNPQRNQTEIEDIKTIIAIVSIEGSQN